MLASLYMRCLSILYCANCIQHSICHRCQRGAGRSVGFPKGTSRWTIAFKGMLQNLPKQV